jgi:hypothetical protein
MLTFLEQFSNLWSSSEKVFYIYSYLYLWLIWDTYQRGIIFLSFYSGLCAPYNYSCWVHIVQHHTTFNRKCLQTSQSQSKLLCKLTFVRTQKTGSSQQVIGPSKATLYSRECWLFGLNAGWQCVAVSLCALIYNSKIPITFPILWKLVMNYILVYQDYPDNLI